MGEVRLPEVPYRDALKEYLEVLLGKLKVRFVVLFGSVARGNFGVGSDVDVFIVADGLSANFDERLKMLFSLNPTTAPIEPVAYTPEEFEVLLEKRHAGALYVMDEGIVLYDDGLYGVMKEKFERLKRDLGIVKGKVGWYAEKILAECLK
ncbi:MAG: nucleotidyltransferase domain-containing protein [Candidatus Bathyarchaeia archaeon]